MDRWLRRLPPEDRGALTPAQVSALARVLAGRYATPSLLDWRGRVKWGGRSWYVTLRIGADDR